MPDYKELYLKLFRASEKAVNILITAQQECEELYISQPEPELKIVPLSSEKKKSEDEEWSKSSLRLLYMYKEIVDMIVNIKFVYIEFDIFCILLLCVILYRMCKSPEQGTENIGFRNVVIGVLCGTVLDCLREWFSGTSIKYSWQINRTIDSCVIIMVCIVAFLWLLYVEERLHDRWANKSAKHTMFFSRGTVEMSLP